MKRLGWLVLISAAIALVACGPALPSEPYPSPDEIMAKSKQAMADVASYRTRGDLETISTETEGQYGTIAAEWAAPDRLYLRNEIAGGSVTIGSSETVYAEGRVFQRFSEIGAGAWREITESGRKISAPGDIGPEGALSLDGVEAVNGQPVYHVVFAPEDFDPSSLGAGQEKSLITMHVFVNSETFLLTRVITERELITVPSSPFADATPEAPSRATIKLSIDFYDYGEQITIEVPEDVFGSGAGQVFPPPPTATAVGTGGEPSDVVVTLMAERAPTEAQWIELSRIIEMRLSNFGADGLVLEREGDTVLKVRLPARTIGTERAIGLLTATGDLQIIERKCLDLTCREGEYEDVSAGITALDVDQVLVQRTSPDGPTYGVVLMLREQAASAFAAVSTRIYETNITESPDKVVVSLDGATLLAAGVDVTAFSSRLLVADGSSLEEARHVGALLSYGPLPVPLSLVSAEPVP